MSSITAFFCLLLVAGGTLVQTPSAEPNYSDLARHSSALVIGVVEGTQWVIRPDRRGNKATPLSNGQQIVELPDPSKYMVGRIVSLRVSEVLKGGSRVKVNSAVNIFIPGSFVGENTPVFAERQKYVVFLSSLTPHADEFAGTVVYKPGARPGGEPQFEPKLYYTVVGDAGGAVHVAPENGKTIGRIRSAIRR